MAEFKIGDVRASGTYVFIPQTSWLSQSLYEYYYCDSQLDIYGYISKATPDGIGITCLIEQQQWDALEDKLLEIAFSHITGADIRFVLSERARSGWDTGRRKLRQEFRNLLRIPHDE